MAQPISLSLTGATTGNTVATANPHQTSLQIGRPMLRKRSLNLISKVNLKMGIMNLIIYTLEAFVVQNNINECE